MSDKWDRRYRAIDPATLSPAAVVTEFAHLLPSSGEALDLACGLGANARCLARRGLRVSAWDSSAVAIERLRAASDAEGLAIYATVHDVVADPPAPDSFDVLVVSRFLERALCPALIDALRPGGLLFYQTYTEQSATGPSNPAYRLETNELLRLFAPLVVVAYREDDRFGDLAKGLRGEALLVAAKPSAPLPNLT